MHVYLLDYSCLQPPPSYRVPTAGLFEHLSLLDCFDDQSVDFMSKVVAASGMGDETCLPPSLHYLPPITEHPACLEEARLLMFPTIDNLFAKTRVKPDDVDLLVVNCSGFCPAPSLSAMVVNRYALREDVKSFNLSGMGCGAGAIAVDVARGAMLAGSARCALLVSTEVVSTGWYAGRDRRKLLLNCFFRMGCSAVLLTNRGAAVKQALYKLVRLLRTNRAFDDRGYRAGYRKEDEDGITGFSIERDWFDVAPEVLRANVVALGRTILPANERIRYMVMSVWRDWRKAIQHFCLPASGRVVIEKIGKGLGLGDMEMEAARMTFHRFGNQSSSSMWYQLAYEEAKGRVVEGERVWQVALGSGPKCSTLVWECLRRPPAGKVAAAVKGPWASSIHRYPVTCDGWESKTD
ncbi:3-ketoacyl-CoA synthase 6 [Platanthera guangdongensis]|uniref:very-long-chain 3-oxoacyl-CoA synthase n=1 Tax=Platanthera guangdongensis TaxID=2320717 RepID=A0ABR2LPZ9_9ASPA